MILAAAGVRDQPIGQLARDVAVVEPRRFADRAQQIVVPHPRQQVLGRVHDLGEIVVARAGAEELRSHRDDGAEPLGRGGGRRWMERGEEAAHQQRFLRTVQRRVREQLLELVEQDADLIVGAGLQQRGDRRRRVAAEVERAADLDDV